MNQANHLVELALVADLKHIFQGKIIDIHDSGSESSFLYGFRIALDDILFNRHQKDLHLTSVSQEVQNLIIEIDVFQAFRDDVGGFELNVGIEFLFPLCRELDLFYDDGSAWD